MFISTPPLPSDELTLQNPLFPQAKMKTQPHLFSPLQFAKYFHHLIRLSLRASSRSFQSLEMQTFSIGFSTCFLQDWKPRPASPQEGWSRSQVPAPEGPRPHNVLSTVRLSDVAGPGSRGERAGRQPSAQDAENSPACNPGAAHSSRDTGNTCPAKRRPGGVAIRWRRAPCRERSLGPRQQPGFPK